MNTVNNSTGFSPFQLKTGHSPRLVPPFSQVSLADDTLDEATRAAELFTCLDTDIMEARDNLFLTKVNQAALANRSRSEEISYAVGDKVMLSTFHRHHDYMQRGDNHIAKFMVRYDGPYSVLHSYPEFSAYTLNLPASTNIFPTFHASLLKPWFKNNPELFPSHQCSQPGPIITTDGAEEWEVESIVDHHPRGHSFQYLVRFCRYGLEHDIWLSRREVNDLAALDEYLLHSPH
ncbi:Transposon Ty3-G Gag-Pol polyprotein [Sparassis crispa]|uniref:Transposon Ty3-G Gag-Pol polyprotein n=1 Tax=Sparassis crispa TaxID=139825 RepID=A0A401GSW6_9APHY|nr:Transposon Ty3-G Gag-Pol polyprotein [Sparassis crispa]GBE85259.1 Transposon Ty3-G Gag-Pol polyprotein [Sparassis crispa]